MLHFYQIIIWLSLLYETPDATKIIREAEKKMQGNSNSAVMTMTIRRPEWSREIKMKSWSLGTEKSLILITSPPRDAGTAFLKREKEIWNWQPRIDRVIKLPPSMMMQSWMGSDFTNDDLVRESSIVEDYSHSYIKDTTIRNYEYYKIQLVPKPEAPVVWGKVDVFIEKNEYLQLLIKYYDEDDYLVNTMVLSEVKEMGGRIIPTLMEMIPADEPDHKTIIKYEEMSFDINMEDSFFSLQNMKRVK
jgi:hypothetical protein